MIGRPERNLWEWNWEAGLMLALVPVFFFVILPLAGMYSLWILAAWYLLAVPWALSYFWRAGEQRKRMERR